MKGNMSKSETAKLRIGEIALEQQTGRLRQYALERIPELTTSINAMRGVEYMVVNAFETELESIARYLEWNG